MPRVVRAGLIQAQTSAPRPALPAIKKAMVTSTEADRPGGQEKVQLLCLQEIFYGPYFCAEQETGWYPLTERVPDGPTIAAMSRPGEEAMVVVVPIYEEELPGVYYNTAAVIDADGMYLGKYRKTHIPHCKPGFWEKFYFRPGNLGYPVFETAFGKVGVYICYDRHFPEGARALGLERGGDRLQPVRHRGRPVANTSGSSSNRPTRWPTATSWGRSTASGSKPPEHRRVLRPEPLLRPARADRGPGSARRGRARGRRPGPRHDPGGPERLAVLPRPATRRLRPARPALEFRAVGPAAGAQLNWKLKPRMKVRRK